MDAPASPPSPPPGPTQADDAPLVPDIARLKQVGGEEVAWRWRGGSGAGGGAGQHRAMADARPLCPPSPGFCQRAPRPRSAAVRGRPRGPAAGPAGGPGEGAEGRGRADPAAPQKRPRHPHTSQDADIEALEAGQEASKPARVLLAAAGARARYALAAYHRARLEKVEAHAAHFVNAPAAAATVLCAAEAAHASRYWLAAGRHLKDAAAARLPPSFESLSRQSAASAAPDMVTPPAVDGHVVARALADRGTLELPGGDAVDLRAGDIYALPYAAVRGLLADEWVALV